jgi:hypothetical protein
VKLTAHLHVLLPVRTSGAILPLPHIHMWLTANYKISYVSLDKNSFTKTLLLSACSHTIYNPTVRSLPDSIIMRNWVLVCREFNL